MLLVISCLLFLRMFSFKLNLSLSIPFHSILPVHMCIYLNILNVNSCRCSTKKTISSENLTSLFYLLYFYSTYIKFSFTFVHCLIKIHVKYGERQATSLFLSCSQMCSKTCTNMLNCRTYLARMITRQLCCW